MGSLEKKPKPRQFTWVCGTEQVLVEEVIERIHDELAPTVVNYAQFVVGEDKERAIWNEMDQHPFGRSMRLVVIRNAERLKNFDRLAEFVKFRTSNPHTYVVFVSGEPRLPRLEPTEQEKRDRKVPALLPHLQLLSNGKGFLIECRPYTQATAPHAIAWVRAKVPMREGIAGHLLDRANGDLRLVRDTCRKLKGYESEIQLSTINSLLAERPRDDFADALLAMDKRTAHLALSRLAPSEYSRTIGFLDARLETAGLVHDLMTAHKEQKEIAAALGSQRFLVGDLMAVAKYYDVRRREAIRKVLSEADAALQGGQTDAVMELVVAMW